MIVQSLHFQTIAIHFVLWPSSPSTTEKFHEKQLGGYGWEDVFGGIIIKTVTITIGCLALCAWPSNNNKAIEDVLACG